MKRGARQNIKKIWAKWKFYIQMDKITEQNLNARTLHEEREAL